MTASHDIAEYGRCRWTAARALAEHELAVITLAAYDHAVVLIVHPIYITVGSDKFGHHKHGKAVGSDFGHLCHNLDFCPFFERTATQRANQRQQCDLAA